MIFIIKINGFREGIPIKFKDLIIGQYFFCDVFSNDESNGFCIKIKNEESNKNSVSILSGLLFHVDNEKYVYPVEVLYEIGYIR